MINGVIGWIVIGFIVWLLRKPSRRDRRKGTDNNKDWQSNPYKSMVDGMK